MPLIRLNNRPAVRWISAALAIVTWLALAGCEGCSQPTRSTASQASSKTQGAPPSQASEVDAPKVAFLGDSIAAGLHLPADEAFPAVLQRRLRAEGQGFRLINAGVSGDTTAGGLRRVDWLLKQDPDVVVVELGANDGMRGVPLDTIERNLRGILEKVQQTEATPLLLGMRLPPSYGADYAAGFAAIYPRLARELDVAYVPFFMEGVAGRPALNLEDGLHPTAEGHERLADNVAPALQELLESGGS